MRPRALRPSTPAPRAGGSPFASPLWQAPARAVGRLRGRRAPGGVPWQTPRLSPDPPIGRPEEAIRRQDPRGCATTAYPASRDCHRCRTPASGPEIRRPLPLELIPVDRQRVVDGDRVTYELSHG